PDPDTDTGAPPAGTMPPVTVTAEESNPVTDWANVTENVAVSDGVAACGTGLAVTAATVVPMVAPANVTVAVFDAAFWNPSGPVAPFGLTDRLTAPDPDRPDTLTVYVVPDPTTETVAPPAGTGVPETVTSSDPNPITA